MTNPILIHLNRKYHVPLESIFRILQKKTGRTWVYFKDQNGQTKIAVAKQEPRLLLNVINQYLVMYGKKQFILEKE